MPTTTRLNHRHQASNLSFSSASSSSSSTRPALPQILSNSASNAVNFSRSAAPTSRRVRSHWFTHFVLNWRRSSRSSKLLLGLSMTSIAIQVITCIIILLFSWEMYCDKPLRVFVTVYLLRQFLIAPITIYLHLAPRRRPTSSIVSPRASVRSELSEAYALSERRPVSFPPPVIPTSHRNQYPPFITPVQQQHHQHHQNQQHQHHHQQQQQDDAMDENLARSWIERAKSALDLFAVLWFIIGNYMLFSSSTCSDTAKPLYYLSLTLIVYGYLVLSVPILLCTSVIFCLPCVLVGMRLIHVDDGVYMGGATPEEIAIIPVFQFKTKGNQVLNTEVSDQIKLVHPSSAAKDHVAIQVLPQEQQQHHRKGFFDPLWLYLGLIDPPSTTEPEYELLEIPDVQDQICVICLSSYEDGDILCKLWCQHHFHKACVHEWLALNFRCPMCKQDSRGKDALFDV